MRVMLRLQSTFGNLTGIGHYTAQLFQQFAEMAPGQVIGSMPQWPVRLYRRIARLDARNRKRLRDLPRRAVCKSIRVGARLLQWANIKLRRYDVYHEPNFIPTKVAAPTIATIHDLSLLRPEWHPPERIAWFERYGSRMLSQCVHFLTDAQAVRREIVEKLGVSASRVTAIPLGVRSCFYPMAEGDYRPALQALGLPPRYLLYVGTIEPRKNVLTLLRAYCDLPAPLREKYPLVLAGGWGWKAEKTAAYYEETARHRGVVHLGYVPEEALAALYNGARALAFPSLYEGFGLPPLEMLACGGAVLASRAATVQEMVGGQAELIEAEDVTGWRNALARVVADDVWHRQLRRGAAEHARPFTWEGCAHQTWRVYESIAAGQYDCAPPIGNSGEVSRELQRPATRATAG